MRETASWASSEAIRRTMRGNRARDTAPELALRRAVHRLGLRYVVSRRPIPAVRRTGDLVFPRLKVVVFLDGCFWHGCPLHYQAPVRNAAFWVAKYTDNRRRDADTDARLTAEGWRVVRVWEHELADLGAAQVHDAVAHALASRRSERRSPPTPSSRQP